MFCAVALGICGPVALTVWLSREFAEQVFRQRVDEFTERALMRSEVVARDAIGAARDADRFVGEPCSEAHLAAMRSAALQHRYARRITYIDNGQTRCASSWFPDASHDPASLGGNWIALPQLQADYRIQESAGAPRAIQFRVGHHATAVDAQFFIDIVPFDQRIRLGLVDTHAGGVVAAWHGTDAGALQRAWSENQDGQILHGRYLDVKASRALPFAVIAYEPITELTDTWRHLLFATLPVALVVSAIATWLTLRWGSRLRSPRHALQDAVRRREFFAVYQPVMALDDGRCVGAEALVRWRLPDGTVVLPDKFIPMAEVVGTIHAITTCVIDAVLKDLGPHLAAETAMHVSINLSPDDFRAPDTLPAIHEALARSGVRAEQVWIEVTERGFANDAACRATIGAFRNAGHPILIDDFGTGYSSLAYLHDLDVDGLKIDKAFVESLTTDAPSKSVGPHIIDMAKALGIHMVAEGIETDAQYQALRERGVQFGQGWLFGKAMPLPEFLAFWHAHANPQAAAVAPASLTP